MEDFRVPLIRDILTGFRLVVPVASPKGGVGKTTISVALALTMAKEGILTALLDSDFTNPTTHIALGVDVSQAMPEEEKGIIPVKVEPNLEFMSPAFYSKDEPLPLRGRETVYALRELLAVTRWSSQVLVVDTPPGLSDVLLELLRLHRDSRVLVVSTCDKLSLVSTRRMLEFLSQERLKSLGVVGNMCSDCRGLSELLEVDLLGCIPFIEDMSTLEGDRERLIGTLGPSVGKVKDRIKSLLYSLVTRS